MSTSGGVGSWSCGALRTNRSQKRRRTRTTSVPCSMERDKLTQPARRLRQCHARMPRKRSDFPVRLLADPSTANNLVRSSGSPITTLSRTTVAITLKMYFSIARTREYCRSLADLADRDPGVRSGTTDLIVLSTFVALSAARQVVRDSKVNVGAQDLAAGRQWRIYWRDLWRRARRDWLHPCRGRPCGTPHFVR